MKTERVTTIDHPEWETFWRIYEASFPAGERRTLQGQKAVIGEAKYFLELWRNEQDVFVGFTACWIYERFRYLEHFAVSSEMRNGGYGKTILTEWMRRPGPPVLLEIDPPMDEISRRRHGFYKRLGFCDNDLEHSHPSYQDGSGSVPLRILSFPEPIEKKLHEEFVRLQCDEMLAHLKTRGEAHQPLTG